MSVVEHPDSWFPEFNRESGNGKYDMIAKMILSKKKCCDNCEYLYTDIDESVVCSKDVANDEYGVIIINSNTFYCSYHKFKV